MKIKKIIFLDHVWLNCSTFHILAYNLREKGFKGIIKNLGYAHCPCPTSQKLENYFYPSATEILKGSFEILNRSDYNFVDLPISEELINFRAPF